MAYSDYGAFVYCNGERRRDKEDVATFATDEETFGESSNNIPSGMRIWASLFHQKENGTYFPIHHGILGDGVIRVECHKQGLPNIVELKEDGTIEEVKYYSDDIDYYEYDSFSFDYKGYNFYFESGKPYEVEMIEPDGTKWHCSYDYGYGAGFEE